MSWRDFEFSPYGKLIKYSGTDPHECVPHAAAISPGLLQDCQTLETVEIPEGCLFIERSAFEGCANLREVILPSSMARIEERAFADCPSLKRLHFPNGFYHGQHWLSGRLHCAKNAFENCTALADENGFVILDGVAWHCVRKTGTVTVPEGVTKLTNGLFRDCREITGVRLPESLTEIGAGAFAGCTGLYPADSDFIVLDGWLCGYRGNCAEVAIPDGVTAIAASVFENHKEIRQVHIPESVTDIGERAFAGCENLQQIRLPDRLEILSAGTFLECVSLRSVQLPGKLKQIGIAAFRGCSALTALQLPEGLTKILGQAFSQCSQLAHMNLPDSLKMIAGNPFAGSPFMPREDGLIIADGKVSGYHGSGGEVIIPEGVTDIEDHAFSNSEITSVTFPKSLRRIGDQAFVHCKKLQRVELQEGLTAIGNLAFAECCIEKVTLPKTLSVIGNEAFLNNQIQEVLLPNRMDKIGNRVFTGCPIRAVSLPRELFEDHGVLPGEFHRWADHYIDANPFPYKDGEIIRTRIICRDFRMTAQMLTEWSEFLSLEDPIIQVWIRDWYDCEGIIPAAFFFDDDADYRCPWLAPLTLDELPWGHEDYVVVILNRNAITELIRSDDESIMDYLENIGPEILRELAAVAEDTGAKTVQARLNRLHEEISALTPDDLL